MRFLVLLAFFCSGFTSLVLESLWVRELTLVFGGTTLAIVTVLTAFMGGLALGSFVAGKRADRLRRPIMSYGSLEMGVALYALLLPTLLSALPFVYRLIPFEWPFFVVGMIRFVLCLLLLLLPTTLMGATLPVLSRYFAQHRSRIGFDVGLLYSANTFGAVLGALGGGFLLLPLLGHRVTLWVAAGLLLSLGLLMVLLGRKILVEVEGEGEPLLEGGVEGGEDMSELVDVFEQSESYGQGSGALQRVVLVCLMVTGGLAMICQVIWSRALAMIIGSSTYAFTIILGTFLSGLALGAAYGAWLARRSLDPVRSWSMLLLGTAFSVAMGSLFMDRLPLVFVTMVYDIAKKADPLLLFSLKGMTAAIPILIPTLLMGTFFPLALSIYSWKDGEVGRNVGRVYAANTVGSIVGASIAGFIVIPTFRMQGGLAICVCLYLLCAWGLLAARKDDNRLLLGIVVCFGCVGVWLFPAWNPGRMNLGMFRLSLFNSYSLQQAMTPGKVLFYKEGVSATVSVEGNKSHRALKVNGKTDASNVGDRSTQIGVAALPLMLHGNARDAVIVGWGSGMTVGAALQFPLKRLTAVELEPAVIEGAKLFSRWNFEPLKHLGKRLRLFKNDGRNYLSTTREKFDVVISEPSNPWMSGVANLFTVEYFQIVKKRLKPGGLFCQWVQIYELSYENILMILRSVRKVFPYVRLFEMENGSYDKIVIASMSPIVFDLKKMDKMIKKKSMKSIFSPMKVKSAHDFVPRLLLGEKEMDDLFKSSPVVYNTDNHNILEFTAPLDLVRQYSSKDAVRFKKAVKKRREDVLRYVRAGRGHLSKEKLASFWRAHALAQMRYGEIEVALDCVEKAGKLGGRTPAQLRLEWLSRLMDGKGKEPPLNTRPPLEGKRKMYWKGYVEARRLFLKDRPESCLNKLKPFVGQDSWFREYPELLYFFGACSRYADRYSQAIRYFERYIDARKLVGGK